MGWLEDVGNWIGDRWNDLTGVTAAQLAADAQSASAQQGIDAAKPYTDLGSSAATALGDLAGLNGSDAAAAAIKALSESPEMKALLGQGENALLANASATGGLRGGNLQGALATFRPQMLSDLINKRFSQFGGLAGIGQQGVGMINPLFAQQGAANAGVAMQRYNGPMDLVGKIAGIAVGAGGF